MKSKTKTRLWLLFIAVFTIVLGSAIMSYAEEEIVNGTADVSLVFEVYGAYSGDPCQTASTTNWNCKYYIDGASARVTANATVGALNSHTDNSVKQIGDGLYKGDFPDTCFDGGIDTKVTCWLTEDSNAIICKAITVRLVATQTGDSYARLGAPVGASISADLQTIEGQTDDIGTAGAGLTDLGGMSTGMKAEVNAEADTALTDYDGPTDAEMDSGFAALNDPTAAAIVDEWESQSQADPTGFHVNVKEVNGESPMDDDTVRGHVRYELEKAIDGDPNTGSIAERIKTFDDAYTAAKAAALTDWLDAGRLDALLDAIKAKTDNLPTDPADDSDIDGQLAAIQAEVDNIDGEAMRGTDSASTHSAADIWAVGTRQLTSAQTFDITGNLSGSVGSVTGAVGSVTGNVGGNVTGSVGSVVADVGIDAGSVDDIWNEATADHTTETTFGGELGTLDPNITAIKAVTDNLPNSGALTDIDTGVNNIEAKLPSNYIMGSSDQTDKDDDIDDILVDTGEIGVAGAGLTNIDLPNQTMDITGNLSGSVGSVTGAVGSVTGNVGGNVTGTIGGMSQAALADFFLDDSGTDYASSVAGSVVQEIADNSAGASLSEAGIADAVWNEATTDHEQSNSFGSLLKDVNDGGGGGATAQEVWEYATRQLTSAQTFNLTGNITGNLSGSVGSVTGAVGSVTGNVGGNVTGSIGSLAAQAKAEVNAEADTALTDYDPPTDTEMDSGFAGLNDTTAQEVWEYATRYLTELDEDNTTMDLDTTGAGWVTATGFATSSALSTHDAKLDTVDNYIDTEVAAIKAKTDNLPTDPADDSDLDVAIAALPTATEIVAALMADTGFTEGGTLTFEEWMKVMYAWSVGKWQDKSGESGTYEILDGEDGVTVIIEITPSSTSPQKTTTVTP